MIQTVRGPLIALICALFLAFGNLIPVGAAGGDSLVTVGSPLTPFPQNKQNEPSVAVDAHTPSVLAAGANDEIDLEGCNVGPDNSCPFTPGVGVSGIYFSTNGGTTWTQPTYTGWTARDCPGVPGTATDTCPAHPGLIGTLPGYYENGLVSDGDPGLAFGPRPVNGTFSWANGSRLYYSNLTSNFSSQRSLTTFSGYEAIAVSRTDHVAAAANGLNAAWMAPVIVSHQNAALFSDKEQLSADNAQSSPYFGRVYLCNTAFRSNGHGGAPEPIEFTYSADGGSTWAGQKQLTPATDTLHTGGRQGCSVRSDSHGVVYVFWEGGVPPTGQSVIYMDRSFDGGATFERPQVVTTITDVGAYDPATGRYSFDGVAGARTDSFPFADIANGAPSGTDATNELVITWPDATGAESSPYSCCPGYVAGEKALVKYSTNGGNSWSPSITASAHLDRPDFPAIAISPNGTDVYLTYDNFLQRWQPSSVSPPRLMQGVVRHSDITVGGAPGDFTDLHRAVTGDARASSQNNLAAEFLGDYNYTVATRTNGIAMWNDIRNGVDCSAVDTYRQHLVESILGGTVQSPGEDARGTDSGGSGTSTTPTKPAPDVVCAPGFGNSDIYGGSYLDPTP